MSKETHGPGTPTSMSATDDELAGSDGGGGGLRGWSGVASAGSWEWSLVWAGIVSWLSWWSWSKWDGGLLWWVEEGGEEVWLGGGWLDGGIVGSLGGVVGGQESTVGSVSVLLEGNLVLGELDWEPSLLASTSTAGSLDGESPDLWVLDESGACGGVIHSSLEGRPCGAWVVEETSCILCWLGGSSTVVLRVMEIPHSVEDWFSSGSNLGLEGWGTFLGGVDPCALVRVGHTSSSDGSLLS